VTIDSTYAADLLIEAMRVLSRARTREAVADVVKTTARRLVAADGATFVLRDGTQCFYLDEDAITPLWKGQRFPLSACVSGWVMEHAAQVVMPDIYTDPRVPVEAYRPTFVKSLVMTPVRGSIQPIAAIGIYWAQHHEASQHELGLLQDLADTTAVALENVRVYEELEQRVVERTNQLTQANQELEAFARTVAHDLRAPLNAVIGFAELLALPETAPEETSDFANEIVGAGRRMTKLIDSLLSFARVKDSSVLQRVPLDLSELMARVAAELRVPARAQLHIAPGLRAVADPELLAIALTNLLSNALKYASKSQAPRVEFASSAHEGGTVFMIRDNGVGFDPAQADRLFKPFERLHRSADFAGTGVGLATVERVIGRHGGRIWAESAPGMGATFYFTLPDAPAGDSEG
jgi:signal transduction histidine kinase